MVKKGVQSFMAMGNQAGAGAPGIGRRLVAVMAVACGLAVANLYYAQPLLSSMAQTFHSGAARVGWIVTMSQAGYAAGLLFLVPAGDILDRRRLVLSVLTLTPLALVAAALAPSLGFFLVTALAVGLTSVVAQVLVPFAASLATDEQRGKVVGSVMSGLLIGILLARTGSGLIADVAGWRAVYFLAAAAMVVLALLLRRELPTDPDKHQLSYVETLRSVGRLLRDEPAVRFRSVYGALGFATFSVFWTTVAFVLAGPPYNYGEAVIGLFGLIGAAGAMAASLAGRLADRGLTLPTTGALAAALLLSFGLLWAGGHSLGAMVAGIILLDVAVQGLHVLNQSEIYRAAPGARSRVNSAYMTIYFVGGAIGSAVGSAAYGAGGWDGVCRLGLALGATALLVWVAELMWRRSGRKAVGAR